MAASKKVGGLVRRGRDVKASRPKLGGIKEPPRPLSRLPCCEGHEVVPGTDGHAARCPETVALSRRHHFRESDWKGYYQCCFYECDPMVLDDIITHDWRCPFWQHTDRTPFD